MATAWLCIISLWSQRATASTAVIILTNILETRSSCCCSPIRAPTATNSEAQTWGCEPSPHVLLWTDSCTRGLWFGRVGRWQLWLIERIRGGWQTELLGVGGVIWVITVIVSITITNTITITITNHTRMEWKVWFLCGGMVDCTRENSIYRLVTWQKVLPLFSL